MQQRLWTRLLAKWAGRGVALAMLAFVRRRQYDLIYSDSENNGLVLAFLLGLTRRPPPLVMLGHRLTPPRKAWLLQKLSLHRRFARILVHSSAQQRAALEKLHFPPGKVQSIPYGVDTEFWQTQNVSSPPPGAPAGAERPYICTAGLEFRDYPTLLEAMESLERTVDLRITTASRWSKRRGNGLDGDLPPNVNLRSYSYAELRELYAGSLFVVVPLYSVDFQAGITLILEAMAMGKAVVVSSIPGQLDTVLDPNQPGSGSFVQQFGTAHPARPFGPTGRYVPAGDTAALRAALRHLLDHPEEALALGREGRRTVEALFTVEGLADRIRAVVAEVLAEGKGQDA